MAINLSDAQIKELFPTYFDSSYTGKVTVSKIRKILKLYSDKKGGRTYIGDKLKLNQTVVGRILTKAIDNNIIKKLNPEEFETRKAFKLYEDPSQRKILISLGLNKINRVKVHNDHPSILGMIDKIKHLLEVQKVK